MDWGLQFVKCCSIFMFEHSVFLTFFAIKTFDRPWLFIMKHMYNYKELGLYISMGLGFPYVYKDPITQWIPTGLSFLLILP